MNTSYGGVEVSTEVKLMNTYITELENLKNDMQDCTDELSSLQQNISNDSGWVSNGKEECARVLLLLAQYSALLSNRELDICGGVCNNASLNSKNVTGENEHYEKMVEGFSKYCAGATTFTDATAPCIVKLDSIQ